MQVLVEPALRKHILKIGMLLAGEFLGEQWHLRQLSGAGDSMGLIGADAATAAAGTTFLYWYIPGLALQFALVVMGSALRGTGIVQPTMIVQASTVLLNTILAPVLIAGWGTGHPLGVAGAALASSIAVLEDERDVSRLVAQMVRRTTVV